MTKRGGCIKGTNDTKSLFEKKGGGQTKPQRRPGSKTHHRKGHPGVNDIGFFSLVSAVLLTGGGD